MQARQAGQALLILLALLAVIIVAASVTVARGTQQSTTSSRAAQTQVALNAARQALVAYAAGVTLTNGGAVRAGELPCPDLTNNGFAAPAPCTTDALRLGRLPWRTLGLPDLRDGSGERLWYAVSSTFVNSPRTTCANPTDAGCLNSNTSGKITVRDQWGTVVSDGTLPTAAIAVVIAPGSALTRLDGTAQVRGCTGDSNVPLCLSKGICSSGPTTPLCNPINYLDIAQPPVLTVPGATASAEDNAAFVEGTATDGFINGPISDSGNAVWLNDVVMAVSYEDLMPLVQRRVAQEVMKCLQYYAYAVDPTTGKPDTSNPNTSGGYGHYPWAASPVNASSTFADTLNVRFGHVPDNQSLTKTQFSLQQTPLSYAATNSQNWPSNCAIGGGSGVTPAVWWMSWKAMVFYAVAQGYSPDANTLGCTGTNCLTINSGANSTKVVVLVAGRALAGQSRTSADVDTASMYLEATNPTSDPAGVSNTSYQAAQANSTFNDVVVYQ